jgi:DNA repair exonuclease SbcCD ATPase subunit
MLDECREIWVSSYGADQPMTQVDVETLDQRAATLLAALDSVREEVGTLRTRVAEETAAALAARANAEHATAQAQAQARQATAECTQALAEADHARRQADDDRAHLRTAQELADQAIKDKDQAVAQRQAAENDKRKAEADRQRALDQVSAAQDRIAELQATLAGERATVLERLDQLRREHDQAREDLRSTLAIEYDQKLRARTEEFNEQVHALSAAADHRVSELTSQLTQATQTYADALGPLHNQLSQLRNDLTEQSATASTLRQQLDDLRSTLNQALNHTAADEPLRQRVATALDDPQSGPRASVPSSGSDSSSSQRVSL